MGQKQKLGCIIMLVRQDLEPVNENLCMKGPMIPKLKLMDVLDIGEWS